VRRAGADGEWLRLAIAGAGADHQAWARQRDGMVTVVAG
jgi:hypothetical protein